MISLNCPLRLSFYSETMSFRTKCKIFLRSILLDVLLSYFNTSSKWKEDFIHVLIRLIKKTHSRFLLGYEPGLEESEAGKDRSRCSSERRIFRAQSQLSSSIRSEVMKNKLRHVKSRMKHIKKTIFIILLLLNPLSG